MTRKLQKYLNWEVLEITTSNFAEIRVERSDTNPGSVRLATSFVGDGRMRPTEWYFTPQALREMAQICNEIADNLEHRP